MFPAYERCGTEFLVINSISDFLQGARALPPSCVQTAMMGSSANASICPSTRSALALPDNTFAAFALGELMQPKACGASAHHMLTSHTHKLSQASSSSSG